MTIGIDTDTKTINLYGNVNLRELFNTLKALDIDKDEWSIQAEPEIIKEKEYIYIPSVKTIPWVQPIPYIQPYRTSPWYGDVICNNQMHSNVSGYNTSATNTTLTKTS